jgi:hypothetical protein
MHVQDTNTFADKKRSRLFIFSYFAVVLTYAVFMIVNMGRSGIHFEEIMSYLDSYPKILTETNVQTTPETFQFIAPDNPAKGLHIIKSPVWPVVSLVWNGFRIPLFMDPQGGAIVDNLFLPLRIIFPYSIVAVRIVSLTYVVILLVCFCFFESKFNQNNVIFGGAVLLMLHPWFLFLYSSGLREETALPLLAYLAIRSLSMYEKTSSRRWVVLFSLSIGLAASAKLHALPSLSLIILYYFIVRRDIFRCFIDNRRLTLPCILIPLIPHFLLGVSGGFSGRPLNIIENISNMPAQLAHAANSFYMIIITPEALMEYLYMGSSSHHFSILYSSFSTAAVIYAFVFVYRTFKNRLSGATSAPVSLEEVFVVLLITSLIEFVLVYKGAHNSQVFFYLMPFFFLIQARFIFLVSSWLAKKLLGGREAVSKVFAVLLGFFFVVFFISAAKTIYMRNHTVNPMFSLEAQKKVLKYFDSHNDRRFYTTAQNHSGFPEFLSQGRIKPYHLYRLFRPSLNIAPENIFRITLQDRSTPYYLFDNGKNVSAGYNNDNLQIRRAFQKVAKELGCKPSIAKSINNSDGNTIYLIFDANCPG